MATESYESSSETEVENPIDGPTQQPGERLFEYEDENGDFHHEVTLISQAEEEDLDNHVQEEVSNDEITKFNHRLYKEDFDDRCCNYQAHALWENEGRSAKEIDASKRGVVDFSKEKGVRFILVPFEDGEYYFDDASGQYRNIEDPQEVVERVEGRSIEVSRKGMKRLMPVYRGRTAKVGAHPDIAHQESSPSYVEEQSKDGPALKKVKRTAND